MLRWIRRLAARAAAGQGSTPVPSGPLLLDAWLRLGRVPGAAEPLETRIELLVGQLSAELSGCRWCIEGGRHRCRRAGLAAEALGSLHAPGDARCFSELEQVALAFAAAVAQGAATDGLVSGPALVAARRHFRECEIVRLTVLAAGEHFGDGLADRPGADPRPSFPISVRGLS